MQRNHVLAVAIASLFASGHAAAQTVPASSDTSATVVVTGTRVANRTALDTASPVDIIGADAIKNTGVPEIAQALSVALPSLNFPRPGLADGTDTVRPATLRGLAPDQTLVLVNSKRRHTSSLVNLNGTIGRGSSSVDMNTIPVAMLKNIEVLRDGASAQYGSDAIAGVVNLRLRTDKTGGEFTATYGQRRTEYDFIAGAPPAGATWDAQTSRKRNDGGTATVSGWKGLTLGESGYLTIAAEYKDQQHTSRPYAALNKKVEGAASKLSYVEVANAQHFDSFIGLPTVLPGYDTRYVPLHVYLNRALDAMYDHLASGKTLPASQVVRTVPRGGTPGSAPAITTANLPPMASTPLAGDAIAITAGSTAITLQRPLLIKGEPGTGKTMLAEEVAQALGMPLLQWHIKSTTKAQQGLYEYDAVSRLRDSQLNDGDSAERVKNIRNYIIQGVLWQAFTADEPVALLIDEIDKADIEFPNDLLREIDRMEFYCYETRELIKAKHRPLVFITSNNEKELPDAFLRRCFFHFIKFPEADTMRQIVNVHFPTLKSELLTVAMKTFYDVRNLPGLKKKPSTSELIDWLKLLVAEDIPLEALQSADNKVAVPPLVGAPLQAADWEPDQGSFERF
eukprot:gene35065-43236_t